ncbi:hypothetical protein OESDEN_19241, partial [Oesophagostomum dentatum]
MFAIPNEGEPSEQSRAIEDELTAQEYGKELERQIELMERAPRPLFESVGHLRERLERENELYRRHFAWQMEN